MKKIQKQLEKEKLRVEERRKEKAEAKAKRKIEREEAAKNGRKLSKKKLVPVTSILVTDVGDGQHHCHPSSHFIPSSHNL